ncbi:MAG: aminotransferase class I/II-fold pyridoxal phosphate-dependent enzyme [Candidatus Lokiarchaeota archaeon]|nr:aminotransferase class I/II-fold pyridoxal phosphate-dependent enzyme [Candidatus Harpocratesius repetitus]
MKISDFLLERYFNRYEFKAPYLLSSSDCESISIRDLLILGNYKESLEKLQDLWLGYTESEGNPQLRAEIAKLYSSISSEQILCFSGAEEGIFVFLNVLLNPDDHIIVQYPAYQSLFEIANSIGCNVSKWIVEETDTEWQFNIETMKDLLQVNTKLIIINQPHNPTGSLISKDDFQSIIDIAKKRKIYLFSDEVYRLLEYSPSFRLPPACDLYENAISLGVLSKAFGLAGLRIGWIATKNAELLRKMSAFKDYTTICNSAPSEFLAILALRHRKHLVHRNLEIIKKNLKYLDEFFMDYKDLFEWKKPRAGSITLVKLKNDISSENFCKKVVDEAGILLLPSTLYEYGDSHFRLGFGRKNLPEALSAFRNFVKEYQNGKEK